MTDFPTIKNGGRLALKDIPELEFNAFRSQVIDRVVAGESTVFSFFGTEEQGKIALYIVLGVANNGELQIAKTLVDKDYPSLTPDAPSFHWFEREIAEQWNVVPKGHPWLKPIRFQPPMRQGTPGKDAFGRAEPATVGVTEYFRVTGREAHEVAVGPVHAGIIEPGHFRFQCHGEEVFHLEIELGYQHRGVERALKGGPDKRTRFYMETLAGDTSIGHGTAFAEVMEALSGTTAPDRARHIRALMLELERQANHTGDLGALAGDIGYLPTLSYCGRLRGDFLNMTGLLCGNRFGRNVVRPGGVTIDLVDEKIHELEKRMLLAFKDTKIAVDLLWATPSVMARFEDTGNVKKEDALSLGWVGPAARACGIPIDVRRDFPTPVYTTHKVLPQVMETSDVFARAQVRWKEIEASKDFILEELTHLPKGAIATDIPAPAPEHLAVSLVEGWRGAICHTAITDKNGRFAAYKVVDPSFHNWFALAMALRGGQISDFPLNNKSFNLSYCGHDL
jgi:Ni,Fe-hydrogenase III large subunit